MIKYLFLLLTLIPEISFSQRIYQDNATGKYGVKDKNGNDFLSADYDDIVLLRQLNNFRAVKDNYVYFYNERGELLNKLPFQEVGKFQDNAARIKQNGRYGVINEFGDITIPVIYDNLDWSVWGMAAISKNGKWGIADLSGNIIAPIIYDTIIGFPQSVKIAIVKVNGKYGILDMISGEYNYKCELDNYYYAGFNCITSEKNGLKGLIHYDGRVIAGFDYDDIRIAEDARYNQKYAVVRSGSKWGVLNFNGMHVFSVEYEEIGSIDKKGIIKAKKDGKDILLDVRNGIEK